MQFKFYSPCKLCPYRMDAPLAHWSIEEFKDLILKDNDYMGTVYGCHKKDNTVCRGWLMDQDNRHLPSIYLRLELSRQGITRQYLDQLSCKSAWFENIEEMACANFPELKSINTIT